jgi:hypothetical protein
MPRARKSIQDALRVQPWPLDKEDCTCPRIDPFDGHQRKLAHLLATPRLQTPVPPSKDGQIPNSRQVVSRMAPRLP